MPNLADLGTDQPSRYLLKEGHRQVQKLVEYIQVQASIDARRNQPDQAPAHKSECRFKPYHHRQRQAQHFQGGHAVVGQHPVDHHHECQRGKQRQHAHEECRYRDVPNQPPLNENLVGEPPKAKRPVGPRRTPAQFQQDHVAGPDLKQPRLIVKDAQGRFRFQFVNQGAVRPPALLHLVDHRGLAVRQHQDRGNQVRQLSQFPPLDPHRFAAHPVTLRHLQQNRDAWLLGLERMGAHQR